VRVATCISTPTGAFSSYGVAVGSGTNWVDVFDGSATNQIVVRFPPSLGKLIFGIIYPRVSISIQRLQRSMPHGLKTRGWWLP